MRVSGPTSAGSSVSVRVTVRARRHGRGRVVLVVRAKVCAEEVRRQSLARRLLKISETGLNAPYSSSSPSTGSETLCSSSTSSGSENMPVPTSSTMARTNSAFAWMQSSTLRSFSR